MLGPIRPAATASSRSRTHTSRWRPGSGGPAGRRRATRGGRRQRRPRARRAGGHIAGVGVDQRTRTSSSRSAGDSPISDLGQRARAGECMMYLARGAAPRRAGAPGRRRAARSRRASLSTRSATRSARASSAALAAGPSAPIADRTQARRGPRRSGPYRKLHGWGRPPRSEASRPQAVRPRGGEACALKSPLCAHAVAPRACPGRHLRAMYAFVDAISSPPRSEAAIAAPAMLAAAELVIGDRRPGDARRGRARDGRRPGRRRLAARDPARHARRLAVAELAKLGPDASTAVAERGAERRLGLDAVAEPGAARDALGAPYSRCRMGSGRAASGCVVKPEGLF